MPIFHGARQRGHALAEVRQSHDDGDSAQAEPAQRKMEGIEALPGAAAAHPAGQDSGQIALQPRRHRIIRPAGLACLDKVVQGGTIGRELVHRALERLFGQGGAKAFVRAHGRRMLGTDAEPFRARIPFFIQHPVIGLDADHRRLGKMMEQVPSNAATLGRPPFLDSLDSASIPALACSTPRFACSRRLSVLTDASLTSVCKARHISVPW